MTVVVPIADISAFQASTRSALLLPMYAGGAVLGTGVLGGAIQVPYDCTIVSAAMHTPGAIGNITVDVLRAVQGAAFASIIGGGTKPTIANAAVSQWYIDNTLSGWTSVQLASGDWLLVSVASILTLTAATLALRIQR